MKNLAITAVILGVLANAATAEGKAPTLTLAMNSTPAVKWIEPATAINTDAIANEIEQKVSETMEQVSVALDKKLEGKIARELENAMH
jgi:hypothetical protein